MEPMVNPECIVKAKKKKRIKFIVTMISTLLVMIGIVLLLSYYDSITMELSYTDALMYYVNSTYTVFLIIGSSLIMPMIRYHSQNS